MATHNLPYQTTPFIGRSREIADTIARLRNPECRLLTLIGPGGIGKTRLAIEVARSMDDFPDGVYFVPLQSLSAPEQVILTIARVLQYELAGSDEPDYQIFRYLADKQLLLILDNFDHLLAGVATISTLLLKSPDVVILVTSRERLNLREEWIIEVRGLQWSKSNITDVDAVQLFAQIARRVKPGFSLNDASHHVSKICQLVEGMPLAIELVASWVQRVPLQTILDEIETGLDIFESRALNTSERHRSMRATIDYSWRLLRSAEQQVLKKLAVFRGGFQLEAAQVVADASLWELAALVDKSLLRMDATGRYDLHELVRQYAKEVLDEDPDEQRQIYDLHCRYYLRIVSQHSEDLRGSGLIQTLIEIEKEIDNIRAAWEWAIPRIDVYFSSMDYAFEALSSYYDIRGWNQEGERFLRRLVDILDAEGIDEDKPLIVARILTNLSVFVWNAGGFDEAKHLLEKGLEINRQTGSPKEVAYCLLRLAEVNYIDNTVKEGQPFLEESLSIYTSIGDDYGRAHAVGYLGFWYHSYRNHERARQLLEDSVAIYDKLDHSSGTALTYWHLAVVLIETSEYELARHFAEKSLNVSEVLGFKVGIAGSRTLLAETLYREGQIIQSVQHAQQALILSLEVRHMHLISSALVACAHIFALQEKYEQAFELFSLTRQHPATLADRLISIDRGLRELKTSLSTDQYMQILDKNQSSDLENTARELLREWDNLMKLPEQQQVTDILTRRELDVLLLVADGLTNPQIADELVFTVGTVKWYLHQIYTKLEVGNRTQAVARAREMKLLP